MNPPETLEDALVALNDCMAALQRLAGDTARVIELQKENRYLRDVIITNAAITHAARVERDTLKAEVERLTQALARELGLNP